MWFNGCLMAKTKHRNRFTVKRFYKFSFSHLV